jgi:hypothetical protein
VVLKAGTLALIVNGGAQDAFEHVQKYINPAEAPVPVALTLSALGMAPERGND